jgi:hypothetical protein
MPRPGSQGSPNGRGSSTLQEINSQSGLFSASAPFTEAGSNAVSANLSNVDQREIAARLKLRESIDRLKALQLAAENIGALNGMTQDESTQYKTRHRLITRLTEQLLSLENGGA